MRNFYFRDQKREGPLKPLAPPCVRPCYAHFPSCLYTVLGMQTLVCTVSMQIYVSKKTPQRDASLKSAFEVTDFAGKLHEQWSMMSGACIQQLCHAAGHCVLHESTHTGDRLSRQRCGITTALQYRICAIFKKCKWQEAYRQLATHSLHTPACCTCTVSDWQPKRNWTTLGR